MKHTVSASVILLLTACAQLPQNNENLWQPSEHISSFAAEGRLAVKAEGKGSYANFDWTYQPLVETININTLWAVRSGSCVKTGTAHWQWTAKEMSIRRKVRKN